MLIGELQKDRTYGNINNGAQIIPALKIEPAAAKLKRMRK